MAIKQLSVFVGNVVGGLQKMTGALRESGMDLLAISLADTENYGIARCIVHDAEMGERVLREAGYAVRITDVLAVCVPDRVGGLDDVLKVLIDAQMQVQYLYSTARGALIIFRVDDADVAERAFDAAGIRTLNMEEFEAL